MYLMAHLHCPNSKQRQGENMMQEGISAFKVKLHLWEHEMRLRNLDHFAVLLPEDQKPRDILGDILCNLGKESSEQFRNVSSFL